MAMGAFEAIEQLALVQSLKTSFVAYPLVNALHIASIGAVFTAILLLDLGILGAFRPPGDAAFMRLMRRVALTGFVCAAVTGLMLFSVRAGYYAGLAVFQLKLGLIVLAGFNLILFTILERLGTATARRLSAAASLALWSGALLCGRFIGFV